MTIGQKIQNLRKRRNITQKQLSEMIGKGFSTVQKYEIDALHPPVDVLIKIAEALNVSRSYFIADENEFTLDMFLLENDLVDVISPFNDCTRRLLSAFERLNPEGQKTAAERIEELTEIERYTKTKEDS